MFINFILALFLGEQQLFQDDIALIHIAMCAHSGFEEHNEETRHLFWPPQSLDLNVSENLWGYLESKHCARIPPSAILLELEAVLLEEWFHIHFNIVRDHYAPIPCCIQ
ncbi:hypothetical protein AVEN_243847-1 [Araneus ventricosus]|uniref:Tc1-like transposase DDE domain-containing protein n=1 Tax=Araneus ventricosus TaxID=182803 RepID=A0A4Y2A743_ARAVE|nr:hypothetical protein AVEN_243847-1 [Araneus ventricosus]